MNKKARSFINWVLRKNGIRKLSIKYLTLIGFSLVVLPLTCALLYSASQVNKLSQQGSEAIITVADLVTANRQLSTGLNQLQRLSSQYLILDEYDLYQQYRQQKNKFEHLLSDFFIENKDTELKLFAETFLAMLQEFSLDEVQHNNNELASLKVTFKRFSDINQKIKLRSNQLISINAQNMQHSADTLSRSMLNSLMIIPVTFAIAILFSLLIIWPLRQLSEKIERLESGKFEQNITFSGAKEIKEIADALEKMRARLHALELQKSSFIRHISHELKTPLAAIREGTELLYDNSVGPLNHDQQEVTNILKESVFRLQNLIEDLLDFNIVLDSTSLQDNEIVNLSALIEQSITLRKLDLQSKKLIVNKNYQDIHMQTNGKQLSVILDNLLSNAIKYSPKDASISINTFYNGHSINIEIADQGPGIKKQYHQKIFEAFYQGSDTKDHTIKSSGLGLTIVKELLMRLNGNIHLSTQTTHGLLVRLCFPIHCQRNITE